MLCLGRRAVRTSLSRVPRRQKGLPNDGSGGHMRKCDGSAAATISLSRIIFQAWPEITEEQGSNSLNNQSAAHT